MHDDHVDPEIFASACYEYGRLIGMPAWRMHLHQIQGCQGCLDRVLGYYGFESFAEMAALEEPSSELTRRAKRRALEPLLDSLEPLEKVAQFSRVSHDRRFHSTTMVKALLRRCRSRWGSEPQAALQDTTLALVAAGKISPQDVDLPRGGVREFKALGWAHQGNVFRILCDLQQAEHSFAYATRELDADEGDPLVRAMVLQLKSSLLRAQRRFRWAMVAIDEAVQLFAQEGAQSQEVEALLVRAKLHFDCCAYDLASRDLDQATQLLGSVRLPQMEFITVNLELSILSRLGRNDEARKLLPEASRLAKKHGNRGDTTRVDWCASGIAAGLGKTEEAERLYKQAREGFLELDLAYDVALVSLELAQLYVAQERHAEIQQLASEMIPIFQSREIHRETLAAVKLFADSVHSERAQVETIGKLSAYLANARHDPSYSFAG